MKCNWTENDTKVSYTSYDMDMPYYKIIECNNTNTTKDKENVNERYFCEIHLKQVKETRKLMHKNCISKEKLKYFLSEFYNNFNKVEEKWFQSKADTYANILEKIENGEFDNE